MAGTQFAVDLVFKTQGSKQIKDASKGVKQVSDAAKKAQGSLSGATNNIRKFGATAKASAAGVKSIGAAFSSMLGPIALVTAAIAGVGKAFSAAADRDKELAAMRQGLKNLGITGDEVLGALEQKAKEFGETTLFSPTQYREAVTSLTSFRNIAVKDFDDVIKMSANVAQAMGTNVKDASLQLAKALNAPTIGITALSRSGIQFTETQKEQIKAMEAAGNIAGAQALIMKELKMQYEGVAEAAGTGLAGSFDLLGQRIQEAFESLGKLLEPLAGPILASAVKMIEGMMNLWDYIASQIFPKVVKAFEPITKQFEDTDWTAVLDQVGEILQNIIIQQLEAVVVVIGKVSSIVGAVIEQFKKLSNNPVFKFIADQVGKLANMLGLTGGKIEEYNAAQNKAAKSADDILASTQPIAPAVEDAAQSSTDLAKAQEKVTKQIKETTTAIEMQYKEQEKMNDMYFQYEQQVRKTELTINEALQDQLEAKLESAKTQHQRVKIAKELYKASINQAKIEQEIAKAAVAESVRKAHAQVEMLTLKEKEVEIAVNLARANGTLHSAHLDALEAAREAVGLAEGQLAIRHAIANEQYREIDALYKAKEEAAKMAYEQNKVFDATKGAAGAAASFAQNMNNAATQAERAANAMGKAKSSWEVGGKPSNVVSNTFEGFSQETINAVLSQGTRGGIKTRRTESGDYAIDYQNSTFLPPGSYMSQQWVYDLEEKMREYDARQDPNHPDNQAKAAMINEQIRMQTNYHEAQRNSGKSDADINIAYGGSTIEFDGTNYVMRDDVNGIVKEAVNQMQSNMTRSARTRLELGMR